MSTSDLDRFKQRTRWVYYKAGVAYGPCSVDEILELVENRELDGTTEMMELGTTRRVRLASVRFFAQEIAKIHQEDERRRDEQTFESDRERFGRSQGARFWVVAVVLPLLLVAGLGLGLWYGVFKKGIDSEGRFVDSDKTHELETEAADVVAEEMKQKNPKAPELKEAEEFQENEGKSLESYALGVAVEQDDERKKNIGPAKLSLPDRKVHSLPKVDLSEERERKKKRRDRKSDKKEDEKKTAEKKTEPADSGGLQEMDFSEEEVGTPSPANMKGRVRSRLSRVLRGCAAKAGVSPSAEITASVRIEPAGRLSRLKLKVEPGGVGGMRMCVVAGMAAIRVAPFEGAAVPLTVNL